MPLTPRARRLVGAAAALLLAVAAQHSSSAAPPLPGADPAAVGRWDTPFTMPVQAIAAAVLPTGKVLALESNRAVVLWNPADGTTTPIPIAGDLEMVCSGLAMLPDGRVLANGGHASSGAELWNGHPRTYLFDPVTETWSAAADMKESRYYPATVTLGDGSVLTVNGNSGDGVDPGTSEVWDGTSWRFLDAPTPSMEFYPRLSVLPDGQVVSTGQDPQVMFLDPATGAWRTGPRSTAGRRWGGAAVLLPGLDKVLVFGGGNVGFSSEGHGDTPVLRDPVARIGTNVTESVNDGLQTATTSAEILDLRGTPSYRSVAPLHLPRRDLAGVVLADGNVLALGGTVGAEPIPGWTDLAFHPELFDVASETWTLMAPAERTRGYHSTGVLLPDGRVLFAGGDFELTRGATDVPLTHTGEVYSPPYLFRGPRPVIASAPASVAYGTRFTVTATGAPVAKAALVRLSSTTHSLNTDQRWVGLDIAPGDGGTLRLRAPANGNVAPPGYYMLFLLSDAGVPSVAAVVRL